MSGPDGGGGAMAYAGKGGEVLTVQVGSFANLVGAHFWNIQTEQFVFDQPTEHDDAFEADGKDKASVEGSGGGPAIDLAHDCLFRAGLSPTDGRVTYLPRAVVVDLNGVQPQVRASQPYLEEWFKCPTNHEVVAGSNSVTLHPPSGSSTWDGAVQTVQRAKPNPIPDDGADVPWADVLQWPLHPNSAAIVKQFRHGDTGAPFDRFPLGNTAFARRAFASDLEDSIHFFLEDCDRPQGLQLIMDTADGFAGLGASIAEILRDDHGKIPIFSIATVAPTTVDGDGEFPPGQRFRAFNQATAITRLAEVSSLIAPVATTDWNGVCGAAGGHGSVRGAAEYLATAIDTATLAYRMKNSTHSLGSVANQLSEVSPGPLAVFTALGLSIPLLSPVLGRRDGPTTLSDALHDIKDDSIHSAVSVMSATPDYSPSDTAEVAHCVVRGAGTGKPPSSDLATRKHFSEYDRCSSAHEMVLRYLGKSSFSKKYFVTEARNAVPPLPRATSEALQRDTPALGWFASDPVGIRGCMSKLKSNVDKTSAKTKSAFVDGGLDDDAILELEEAMTTLVGE